MVMKLDAARWRRRKGMARLLDALGADEGMTRYVGGAVRDELLRLPVNDVDLATRLKPEEVVARLEAVKIRAVPTGIDHGTITAVSSGHVVEVTSLRRDVSTDGRRARVAFTDDWQEDAARRDFTINALLADPRTGQVFDYFGGLDDLEARRVRFIGDPYQRIAEDHLRILRFFRFHARFGAGEPDRAALQACAQRANDLMALSRERIADELLKLLAVHDPEPTVGIMLANSIFKPVVPEVDRGAAKRLGALVKAERDAAIEADAARRLSAILPRDPLAAEKVAVRLKLSTKLRKRLSCSADDDLDANPQALAYYVGRACAIDRLLLAGHTREAKDLSSWHTPRLPIGGGELIKRGLKPGPVVARTLRSIERTWVEAGFPGKDGLDTIIRAALGDAKE
jgi:poly(A) polymerase